MKHFFLLVLAVICFSACSSSEDTFFETADYYPFKRKSGDYWGLISPTGDVLIENEYPECPTPVVNGIFFISTQDGMEMYSVDNLKNPITDKYCRVAIFTENVTPACRRGGNIEYINKKGKSVFSLPADYFKASPFVKGYSIISLAIGEDKAVNGVIDTKMKIFQPTNYSIVGVCGNGLFCASRLSDNTSCIIDKSEKEIVVIPDDAEYISLHPNNYMNYVFSFDGKYGVKTINGPVKIDAKYDLILIDYPYYQIYKDGRFGIADLKGKTVVSVKYQDITTANGVFVAQRDDKKFGVIDSDNTIIPFEWDKLEVLNGGKSFLGGVGDSRFNDYHYYLLDKNGKRIDSSGFDSFITLHERHYTDIYRY